MSTEEFVRLGLAADAILFAMVAFGYQIVRDILLERKEYNRVKGWKPLSQRSYK
jgi:hypothetical protein